jgi:hypothetical protein
VFLYGQVLNPLEMQKEAGLSQSRPKFRVFVIRNTQIKPNWQVVKPLVRSIAPRSVLSLIKAQGIGDLYRIFATSKRDGFDFNLAFISRRNGYRQPRLRVRQPCNERVVRYRLHAGPPRLPLAENAAGVLPCGPGGCRRTAIKINRQPLMW